MRIIQHIDGEKGLVPEVPEDRSLLACFAAQAHGRHLRALVVENKDGEVTGMLLRYVPVEAQQRKER